MAKVEMDLAELKQLEAKIEDLENKVVLKEKEKQEILDKQPMVTVLHKYFNPTFKYKDRDYSDKSTYVSVTRSRYTKDGYKITTEEEDPYWLRDYIDLTLVESDKVDKDYKGLSEIISDIRAEEELRVKELLDEARNRATKAEYDYSEVKDEYEKKILKLNKEFDSNAEKIVDDYESKLKLRDDSYNKLKQEFDDFKEDKKRITLEQQIAELTEKLKEATKPKSFIQRLLNK